MYYQNHIESVYYIRGEGNLQLEGYHQWWMDTREVKGQQGQRHMFFMNIHDPHILECYDEDSCCIAIFDPVLTGKEIHHLTDNGFSVYQIWQIRLFSIIAYFVVGLNWCCYGLFFIIKNE